MLLIDASDKPWIATGVKGVVWQFLRESVCCLMRLNPNRQGVVFCGVAGRVSSLKECGVYIYETND